MIRIAVAGTSSFGLPSFQKLVDDSEITLVGVISQPARPIGRHQTSEPTPVAEWAIRRGLPLVTPDNWKATKDLNELRAWEPDLIIVAAYGVIVPTEFLSIPRYGCINLHASLLPKYRGASPVAAAILAGDKVTGVTFMLMDIGLDTGDILSVVECPIDLDDTTPTLTERIAERAANEITEILKMFIEGKLRPKVQPSDASYAKKITRADGRATWDSAVRLGRMSRAYRPWPGLWTTWKSHTVKILEGSALLGPATGPLGTVIGLPRGQWGIQCTDGLYIPNVVQFAGKQAQPATMIPGSYPGFIGSQFDS